MSGQKNDPFEFLLSELKRIKKEIAAVREKLKKFETKKKEARGSEGVLVIGPIDPLSHPPMVGICESGLPDVLEVRHFNSTLGYIQKWMESMIKVLTILKKTKKKEIEPFFSIGQPPEPDRCADGSTERSQVLMKKKRRRAQRASRA